jgi:hypothetical protein
MLSQDNVAEGLRRQIRNLLGFPRVGSNPAIVELFPHRPDQNLTVCAVLIIITIYCLVYKESDGIFLIDTGKWDQAL